MKNSIKSSIWSLSTFLVMLIAVVTYNFAPNLVSGENLFIDFGFLAIMVFTMSMGIRYAMLSNNEVREDE